MNHETQELINRVLAMPKTHKVTTCYANGATYVHLARNLATAQDWADREGRKVGRELISRETNEKVKVISVIISEI